MSKRIYSRTDAVKAYDELDKYVSTFSTIMNVEPDFDNYIVDPFILFGSLELRTEKERQNIKDFMLNSGASLVQDFYKYGFLMGMEYQKERGDENE